MAVDPRRPALGSPLAWSPNPGASALSLAEQIAEQIGNAIIRGELLPGDRVREEEVAGRFSVSRGPVRESLRILERDGLIRIQARRGARVTRLTVDEVDEVFELRARDCSAAPHHCNLLRNGKLLAVTHNDDRGFRARRWITIAIRQEIWHFDAIDHGLVTDHGARWRAVIHAQVELEHCLCPGRNCSGTRTWQR